MQGAGGRDKAMRAWRRRRPPVHGATGFREHVTCGEKRITFSFLDEVPIFVPNLHTHLEEEVGQVVLVEEGLYVLFPMWENQSHCLSGARQSGPSLHVRQGAPMDLEAL